MKKFLNIKNLFIIFLITYPIFDMEFFYNRITTLLRIIIIFSMFIYVLIKYKDKKTLLVFLIYSLILGSFFIIHDNNCNNFVSFSPDNFNYNTIKELLYFIKMSTPLVFMYIAYKIKLNKFEVEKVIKGICLVISLNIIITNIFFLGYSSYTEDIIKGNIFTWFYTKSFGYMELATRGWFAFTNHIVTIQMIMLPLVFYYYTKKSNYKNLLILISNILSLLMLGNRISTFGCILLLIMCVIIWCFFLIIKKSTVNKRVLVSCIIIIIAYSFLLFYSPAYKRINEYNSVVHSSLKDSKIYSVDDKEYKMKYIKNNYESDMINPIFFKYYPYEYDTDFWYDLIVNNDQSLFVDYRKLEKIILDRAVYINDNKNDKYFGIGYSRHMNIVNYERDYINQIYSVGLIGLSIFIMPYIIFLLYYFLKFFKKTNFELFNCCILLSVSLFMIIAYASGNIFNSISTMIPFSFIFSNLIKAK